MNVSSPDQIGLNLWRATKQDTKTLRDRVKAICPRFAVIDNFLYVYNISSKSMGLLFRYDPLSDTWMQLKCVTEEYDTVVFIAMPQYKRLYLIASQNILMEDGSQKPMENVFRQYSFTT